jgi:hypothetical protein
MRICSPAERFRCCLFIGGGLILTKRGLMKRLIFLAALALAFSANALAHNAFTLVSSEKKTFKESEVPNLQKQLTAGKTVESNLEFSDNEIRLVVITGPEEDMLSYRIAGMRNPNLVVPPGVTLRILFINLDDDMPHDLRFGHVMGDFPATPVITETAGTTRLAAKSEDGTVRAEEIVIKATEDGAYKYFCSVRGHAKGGMWGNIFVGVKPGADVKMAPKTQHVHTADEEKMENMPGMKKEENKKPDEMKDMDMGNKSDQMPGMSDMKGHDQMNMLSTINIGEPMTREGSGTAWLPDSSPMYARMKMFSDGSMLMVHGTAFIRYTAIGSDRDVSVAGKGNRSRVDAPSMLMLMYAKPLTAKSQFGFRSMFSLDPLIERGWGYPLLYQSGESFGGQPLHDRQHPHDFISELAATYSYKFDEKNSVYFYTGYPGEPALGPVAYFHRPSGANNPDAPLGHHWQDATHITFGVLTAGYTYDKVKFEVSAFNGAEPDENRWAFDRPKINSFSARLSFNPTKEWSFQISHGYLRNPERQEPEIRILRRTTASAMYNKGFDENHNWANTFIWGQNYSTEGRSNSFLYESNFDFFKNSIFGRMEQVQKNAHELVLPSPHPEGNFWIQSYSIGYLRDLVKEKGVDVGIGTMATMNFNPQSISSVYGGTRHGGWQVFLRLRASKH